MITIRDYRPSDWPDVDRIYREGLRTGVATFETCPKAQDTWEGESVTGSALIAETGTGVLGWAVLWPVSDRCAYAGVAEVSVYVGEAARGHGVGKRLLEALVQRSETLDIWTLQAGIFEDNPGSQAIHRACGFRHMGTRERIGKLNGVWRNTMVWERRSSVVGID
jgi:phosphinothricin acetyltransferase